MLETASPRWTTRLLTCSLLLGLVSGCNGSFYRPDGRLRTLRIELGVDSQEVWFPSGDGTTLYGWFLLANPDRPTRGTVIHFHGNAGNVTSHVRLVSWLTEQGFHVFTFDYRGFGESEGSPSRAGLHEDCRAAIAYVRSREDVDPDRILLLGQSLGGACALAAVADGAKEGIRGIVVDSTFDSYQELANDHLGGSFVTWPLAWLLVSSCHDPVDGIEDVAPVPVLFIHGDRDEIVPLARARALYDAAREPKDLWLVEGGAHLDALSRRAGEYRPRLVEFLLECLDGDGPGALAGDESPAGEGEAAGDGAP